MTKPALTIYLASPRGFCAGVDRAIQIVEQALAKYGKPVYVRHEIVHNTYVVDNLRTKGAIFVDELNEVPDDGQPVIFSAHGVPKAVPESARVRNMFYIDATCPLVSKVHHEAQRYHKMGHTIILIGHDGHPEVIGTMGQLPAGSVVLVETLADVAGLNFPDDAKLAYCTQTTLSVDDTAEIVNTLKLRYPAITGPTKEDICYATTNRQAAVKAIAPLSEALIVIGSPTSSNSNRLVEVAQQAGCADARLVERASFIDWRDYAGIASIGLTAGASAPEILVDEVIESARGFFDVTVKEIPVTQEDVVFKVPSILNSAA